MIDGEINKDDKLVVSRGDFKGLKLFVRDTYVSSTLGKQIILARQDNDLDFCRESENEVKKLCEQDNG